MYMQEYIRERHEYDMNTHAAPCAVQQPMFATTSMTRCQHAPVRLESRYVLSSDPGTTVMLCTAGTTFVAT